MKIIKLFLAVLGIFALPVLAMQDQNPDQNFINLTKSNNRRNDVTGLQQSIADSHAEISRLESKRKPSQEDMDLLAEFKLNLLLSKQELDERKQRTSDVNKAEQKKLEPN